jgi:transposase
LAASRNEWLAAVDPEAASEALRLLSERREDLVAERTRALNRLHALLRGLVPGGVARTLSAERAARILRGIRPKGASARLRRRLASEILRDVRTLDRKIADLNRRIEAEVEASGTTLTEIFGMGPILSARIIGTVGDVGRFPSKAHFASYSGARRRWRPQAARRCATGSRWQATDTSTTPCIWSRYARPGRMLGAGVTTARRWRRARPVRRRCGVSRDEFPTPSSGATRKLEGPASTGCARR